MSITMDELHGNEKYYYMKKNYQQMQNQSVILEAGDFMLFGNDCLVLFMRIFIIIFLYTFRTY